MRLGVAVAVCATLLSCSGPPGAPIAVSPSPAETLAADLRTHLDLLLGEHVMIVAKESAAAIDHSASYDAYASLLAANSADVAALFTSAIGNTATAGVMDTWNTRNGYLVDYAIGVATHDDAKAKAAMLTLTTESVPTLGRLLGDSTGLAADTLSAMLAAQAAADKTFIDAYFAQTYPTFYQELHSAYGATAELGDALAARIAHNFPDKFPGDPSQDEVDRRVNVSLLLQEHAYVSTLATDATVNGRTAEATAAAAALAANAGALAPLFPNGFANLWAARTNEILAYSRGDQAAGPALTVDFVRSFAALARVDRSPVARQVEATLQAIDDQRAKDAQGAKDVAGDDRAAATAMEPIAEAVT